MSKKNLFIIILASLFFDALSVVPIANTLVAAVGQITMAWLFGRAGIDVWRGKSLAPFAIGTIGEVIPALSSLPLFFVETLVILMLSGRKLR